MKSGFGVGLGESGKGSKGSKGGLSGSWRLTAQVRGVAALVAVAVAVLVAVLVVRCGPASEGTGATGTGTDAATTSDIHVDVTGAVRSPAVYVLPGGSRVNDAIEAAGGLADGADLSTVNRAAPLSDGDRVHIPVAGEDPLPVPTPAPGASSPAVIDINTADAEALQSLDGIGPATARAIVDYREEHGPFTSIEGLMDVPGIGQGIFDRVKGRVRV